MWLMEYKSIEHKACFIIKNKYVECLMWFIGYCSESEEHNGCMGTGWSLSVAILTLTIAWLTGSRPCPATRESTLCCVTGLRKDQNSKAEVWFLPDACCCRATVTLAICKLNRRTLGTLCTSLGGSESEEGRWWHCSRVLHLQGRSSPVGSPVQSEPSPPSSHLAPSPSQTTIAAASTTTNNTTVVMTIIAIPNM